MGLVKCAGQVNMILCLFLYVFAIFHNETFFKNHIKMDVCGNGEGQESKNGA